MATAEQGLVEKDGLSRRSDASVLVHGGFDLGEVPGVGILKNLLLRFRRWTSLFDDTPKQKDQPQRRESVVSLPPNALMPEEVSKPATRFIHIAPAMVRKGENLIMELKPSDVSVLNVDVLGISATLRWIGQARKLAHTKPAFVTPVIIVVADSSQYSVAESLRLKKEVAEAGAIFYERPKGCESIEQVMEYMKERRQSIYRSFGKSEAEFLYGASSESPDNKEVHGKHTGKQAANAAAAISLYGKAPLA